MSKRDIYKYTKALVDAGVLEAPAWMAALLRTPPLPVQPLRKGRPPKIEFPEDALITNYYRKHPEARLVPIDLASFQPPTGRRFALRQLELMEGRGIGRKAAYAMVEREFKAEQQKAEAAGARQSIIDQIQTEEELHLQQALRQYSVSHGPEVVRQHAQELSQLQNGRAPGVHRGGGPHQQRPQHHARQGGPQQLQGQPQPQARAPKASV